MRAGQPQLYVGNLASGRHMRPADYRAVDVIAISVVTEHLSVRRQFKQI